MLIDDIRIDSNIELERMEVLQDESHKISQGRGYMECKFYGITIDGQEMHYCHPFNFFLPLFVRMNKWR